MNLGPALSSDCFILVRYNEDPCKSLGTSSLLHDDIDLLQLPEQVLFKFSFVRIKQLALFAMQKELGIIHLAVLVCGTIVQMTRLK